MRFIGKWVVIPTLFLVVTSMSLYAKDVSKHFTAADTDKDGKLSVSEAAASAEKRADTKVEELLKKHDTNGDGTIAKDEIKEKKAQKMGLFTADANSDGKVSKEELTTLLRNKTSERSTASFKARDANSDGFVTPEEVKQFKPKDGGSTVETLKKEGIDTIISEIGDLF
ncbi:MAG TPA: EF-hand domain-containing protein [Candidatus Brocadiaceae bacterium]|nr:EF-hand domain-containing protein [Candidatus Brocadiaceae bacterium]